jgi:uncharacterized membrane protein YdjX (TVP38/TMEM64 family)
MSEPGSIAIEAESPPEAPAFTLRRGLVLAVIAVALVLLATQAGAYLGAFRAWVAELGYWGPVVFILGYALAVVAFVPGSVLTLAGGTIFGVGAGVAYVFVAATLGASAGFLIARHAARDWVEARIHGNARFAAIDRAVGQQGLKIVTLLRLSPVFPFNLLNYALGLTRVRFRDYLIASIGMLPGTVLYVYSGAIAGDAATAAGGAGSTDAAEWVLRIVGLAATLVVTVFVTRIARRALTAAALD